MTTKTYKYAHRFLDNKGEFFILSNDKIKPNPSKSMYSPIGSEYQDYKGVTKLTKLKHSHIEDMKEWAKEEFEYSKDLCYFVNSKDDIDNILKNLKVVIIND